VELVPKEAFFGERERHGLTLSLLRVRPWLQGSGQVLA
jgi:hypothetical protein